MLVTPRVLRLREHFVLCVISEGQNTMKYHLEMWNLNDTVMRASVVANRPWPTHKKIHRSKTF